MSRSSVVGFSRLPSSGDLDPYPPQPRPQQSNHTHDYTLICEEPLNVLDRYPLELPARYANKQANWEKIYLVSNVPLSEQYIETQEKNPEAWRALLRRIGKVVEVKGASDVP